MGSRKMTAIAEKEAKERMCVLDSHLRMHYTRYKIHANYTQPKCANNIQTSLKYGWNDDDYD